MSHNVEQRGSKLILVFIFVVFFYLAFFGFNLQEAFHYTFSADSGLIHSLGF